MDSLESHLLELRNRIKKVAVVLILVTALSFLFSSRILKWLQADLSVDLNAFTAYEAFYTEIMIALILGFFLSLPFTLYQAIKFMKPGLKDHEYRVLRNYLPFSIVLFIIGAAFCYSYVVKTSFRFFESVGREAGVEAVWGLQNTIGFALKLSAFTGIVFQLPIIALVLSKAGLINGKMMVKYRVYFIVAVLVTAAIATPPDIVTQVLITGPVIGLYQLSIFLVKRFGNK